MKRPATPTRGRGAKPSARPTRTRNQKSGSGQSAAAGKATGRPATAGKATGRPATAGKATGRPATAGKATGRPATADKATGRPAGGKAAGRAAAGKAAGRPSATAGKATGQPAGGKAGRQPAAAGGKASGRPATAGQASPRLRSTNSAAPIPGVSKPERLQKVLAQAGIASRRAAEEIIASGRVTLDGRVVTEQGIKVDPAVVRVELDGAPIFGQEPVVLVMNKPDEVVSSAEPQQDERGRPTVVSLLDGWATRVFPIGRLDYHTRGVLLLTNDGPLAAALTHPRSQVPKTYHVKFQGRLIEADLAALHAGVTLEDGTPTRPALEVDIVRATTTNTWVQMTIAQGLYRQIRRMGDAIGHSVLKLIRVAFAGVTAEGLREGQWRKLSDDEVSRLREVACPPAAQKKPGRRGRVTGRSGGPGRSRPGRRP